MFGIIAGLWMALSWEAFLPLSVIKSILFLMLLTYHHIDFLAEGFCSYRAQLF